MITRVSRVTSIERGKMEILLCVFGKLFSFFPGFKILVVRFVEFICWTGECEEVIVVFVAEAEARDSFGISELPLKQLIL